MKSLIDFINESIYMSEALNSKEYTREPVSNDIKSIKLNKSDFDYFKGADDNKNNIAYCDKEENGLKIFNKIKNIIDTKESLNPHDIDNFLSEHRKDLNEYAIVAIKEDFNKVDNSNESPLNAYLMTKSGDPMWISLNFVVKGQDGFIPAMSNAEKAKYHGDIFKPIFNLRVTIKQEFDLREKFSDYGRFKNSFKVKLFILPSKVLEDFGNNMIDMIDKNHNIRPW